MNVTLQLRHAPTPQRPAAGSWLAGNSALAWLNEMATWPTDHEKLQLLAVPGNTDGSISGVLVVVPAQDSAAIQAGSPLGVAYGRIGDRLYVPIDAQFAPATADAEVASLLPDDQADYVWQPSRGLIRCDTTARWDLGKLVAIPAVVTGGWDRAIPGLVLNEHLISIEPSVTIQVEELIQTARDDIGSDASGLAHLPRSPNELRAWRSSLPRFHVSREGSFAAPLALLSLPTRQQASLFTADGRVRIYEFR